jgi:hypothetical protein
MMPHPLLAQFLGLFSRIGREPNRQIKLSQRQSQSPLRLPPYSQPTTSTNEVLAGALAGAAAALGMMAALAVVALVFWVFS